MVLVVKPSLHAYLMVNDTTLDIIVAITFGVHAYH